MIIKLILMLLVLFSRISSQSNTADQWKSYDGAPSGIYAGGFVSCDDYLYSIGGRSDVGITKKNYQYNPATNIWTTKANMKIKHMNGAYVSVDGKIHVIAGDPFSDVHEVYDPIKDEWSLLAPIPTNVQHVKGVVNKGKIYVMGGLETWMIVSDKNQVYDINTDSWVEMAPMPIGKHNYSSIVHDDKIYVFGGDVYDTIGSERVYGSNSSIEVYDIKTDTWESIGNMPTYLFYSGIVVYGDEVIILGGFRDTVEPDTRVDIFSLETYTWREGLPLPTKLVALGAVEYNDQLYVCGGADSSVNWLSNKELYKIPIKSMLENMD